MPDTLPVQAPATEGQVQAEGARLSYWDTGGNGPVIALCHPASQSSRIWLYQQPVFAGAGYRVIAYSRRGHDKSERGAEDAPGTAVGDLVAVLDALEVGQAHLLGAAAGGISAMGLAIAHPRRVRSLILAGTIVSPREPEWEDMYGRLGIAAVRRHVPTEFLELGPAYRASNAAGTAQFVALEHEAKAGRPLAQPLGALVDWASMGRLAMPVLSLTGEADLYAPPPLQALIAAHFRHCEVATLPAVGHAAYWEAPVAFNSLVLDFLARHTPASP